MAARKLGLGAFCFFVASSISCALASSLAAEECDMSAAKVAPRLSAAVLGATGAVGSQVLKVLCSRPEHWENVVLVSRREIPEADLPPHEGVTVTQVTCSMSDADELRSLAESSLGGQFDASFVTMGVGAASKVTAEVLENVDVTLPTAFAEGSRAAGVRHISILTSVGANADASTDGFMAKMMGTGAGGPLYSKYKGTVEKNLQALGFESFSAFRPATLIGTPHTPGAIAFINPFLDFLLPATYKSSDINTLASAMVHDAETVLHGARGNDGQEEAGKEQSSNNKILAGTTLHALYSAIPFPHGMGK